MKVLGIETSCDETAVAIVTDTGEILANIVYSQIKEHAGYQGVVPEIAARAHLDCLDDLIAAAMKEAGLEFQDLDAVAATGGPGLIGGVLVGVMAAKAIAAAHALPFIAVNHLEAHALTARLTNKIEFPFVVLLVSGGHSQLLLAKSLGQYKLLGSTLDDAVGEAFDKSARMMGLGYPGGPQIEKCAKEGDPDRFELPRPLYKKPGCQFSFSGLKTAVMRHIEKCAPLQDQDINDLAASLQTSIAEVLVDRTKNALEVCKEENPTALVVAGGVAANLFIREKLESLCEKYGLPLVAPPVKLCTDNGVMIAWAGMERFKKGQQDKFDFMPRPRWPLEELAING